MPIEFFVPGIARPAGSKNAYKIPNTDKVVVTHACKKTHDWMQLVTFYAMKAANRMILWDEALKLQLTFLYSRPKGHYGTGRNSGILKKSAPKYYAKTTKPDLTKIVRAVEDALTGIIWRDDNLVVQQITEKRYCREYPYEEKPGVLITITKLSETEGIE